MFFFLRSTSPIAFWFCILKVKYAADVDALQWQGITLGHNLTYVEELPVALVETREKTFFCPKRDHTCQIGQLGKERETLLHSVYGSTVKNLTLTFGCKIFSWLPNMYWDSQKKFGRKTQCYIFQGGLVNWGHPSIETLRNGPKWDISLNFAPGGPPMANLDMEPLNIMGDWYQVERKPTLAPLVIEKYFLQKKTQMFQINDDFDILYW